MKKTIILITGVIILLTLINDNENNIKINKIYIDTKFENTFSVGKVVEKKDRLLGIDITMDNSNDYGKALELAKELNIDFTTLSISRDEIENQPYKYENENLKIANDFYPSQNIQLAVIITPIDTNRLRLPKDLKNKKLNDPEVIKRFKGTIDYVLKELNNVDIVSLSIGNEIDLYLGSNKEKWNEYTEFYKEITEHIHKTNKNIKLGTKITLYGLTKNNIEESKEINKYSDVILVTYYPIDGGFKVKNLDELDKDFKRLTDLYKNSIQLLEFGFPEGEFTNSSIKQQALFYHKGFSLWDKYSDNIKVINLNWLHDRSANELSYFEDYYGLSDKSFLDYLGTLGFISYEGKKKSSFYIIKKETEARKW